MTTGRSAQINVTPMIDVLLVLLIIFMVIVPTRSMGLESQVPQPSEPSTAPPPPSTIVIYAKGDGKLEVNSRPVLLAELEKQLMTVFHGRPDSTVFVGGDPDLEFRHIADVIDVCKGARIGHIGLLPKQR